MKAPSPDPLRTSSTKLSTMNSQRSKLHSRITGFCLLLGSVLSFGGFALDALTEEQIIGQKRDASLYQIAWSSGLFVYCIGILPTYSRAVVLVAVFETIMATAGCVLAISSLSDLIQSDLRDIWFILPFWIAMVFTTVCTLIVMISILLWDRHTKRWFASPTRLILRRIWLTFRVACVVMCITTPSSLLCKLTNGNTTVHDGNASERKGLCDDQLNVLGVIAISGTWAFLFVLSSPVNRGRVAFHLGRLALGRGAQSAATIASMLPNGHSPQRTLAVAQEKFRVLPYKNMTSDDLLTNCDNTDLWSRTETAALGQCSCFASHSWSDCGDAKFATLQKWASRFQSAHGSHPTLWLECATRLQHAPLASADNLSSCERRLTFASQQSLHRPVRHLHEPSLPTGLPCQL